MHLSVILTNRCKHIKLIVFSGFRDVEERIVVYDLYFRRNYLIGKNLFGQHLDRLLPNRGILLGVQ